MFWSACCPVAKKPDLPSRGGGGYKVLQSCPDWMFPYANFRCSVRRPGFHLHKPWCPTRHLSKEADTWTLFFKYDSNFNYAVGSEFGEREGVHLLRILKS